MRVAIEFAVPRRVAGVLDPSGLHAGFPESLPLLTSPLGSAETVVLSGGPPVGAFFSFFFCFFRCSKERSNDGRSKNRLFSEILAILVPPTSTFTHFWSQNMSPEATFSVFF